MRIVLLPLLALAILTVVGCGGGSSSSTASMIEVTVSPSTATLQSGAKSQLTATVTGDASNSGVTWNVACTSSSCGSLSPTTTQSGTPTTYSAPGIQASAVTVTIAAVSNGNTSRFAAATVTIPATIISVSIAPPTATVPAGRTASFVAGLTGDIANQGVTWSLSCSTSICGTVSPAASASGAAVTYTSPNAMPVGDLAVVLVATSVTEASVSASVNITVPGLDVTVVATPSTVLAGNTAQLTATVQNDAGNKGVTWTVSCEVSPCGTISPGATASGVAATYTAPSTPPANDLSVTITATSVSNPAATNSANLTVPAISVATTPSSALIPLNATQQFSATLANEPGNAGLDWALQQNGSSCSATCGTILPLSSASGIPIVYTAPSSLPSSSLVSLVVTSVTDKTQSATSTITLTKGNVQIAPNAIDFGLVGSGSSSSPTASTLTNTGTSALSIAGVSISGTDAIDFTQTNTCGASVPPSSSCTISVIFKPSGAFSQLTAQVSIADSSIDSPQSISLSGRSKQMRLKALEDPLLKSTISSQTILFAPKPTGPNPVGTRVIEIIDESRSDPYLLNGSKRDLLVRMWYPTSLSETCVSAEYTSAKVWNYFAELLRLRAPSVITNSCQDASAVGELRPVVIFSPGYTATFSDYTFLLEDLASRGYVIASVDHTYEATAEEFPDGRFVKSVLGSHLGGTMKGDERTLAFATLVRVQDLRSVFDGLQRLNTKPGSPFAGRLDMTRVAVAGHSLGGLTSLLGAERDTRFRAAVSIDGIVPASLIKPTFTPVLLLTAGREQWDEDQCSLWNNLQGPRAVVNLVGAEHFAPSDLIWLTPDAVKTGSMGPDKTIQTIRDSIAAFLDETTSASSAPVSNRLSSSYFSSTAIASNPPQCRQP